MFYISGAVNQATLKRLIRYLHFEATNADLYVYINSPGGCTRSALAIFEILRSFHEKTGAKVITQALDDCYSAALIVYLAGDERYATEFASFMIHEVTVEEGKDKRAKGYKQTAGELEKETAVLYNLIKKRTKLQVGTIRKRVEKARDNDWIFDRTEALKWNLVTHKGFHIPDPPEFEEDEDDADDSEEGVETETNTEQQGIGFEDDEFEDEEDEFEED